MASKMEEIEKEMLLLPIHERAALAKKLLLSLDSSEEDEFENENEVTQAWIDEAAKRAKKYEKDPTKGRNADEVLKRVRSKFQ
jgi:putative addiction module component (TIGR02574 family)